MNIGTFRQLFLKIFINSYLFLKDEKLIDVKIYYNWGQLAHNKGLFGKDHSSYFISRNQIGIPQKINFTNSKTLALRFLEPAMGAGAIMFGFFSTDEEIIDLFFAYLTSSLFLLDALQKSRIRSAEFVRIHKVDFYTLYKFPDLQIIKTNQKMKEIILKNSLILNNGIPLGKRHRFKECIQNARIDKENALRKLDEAWFVVLNIDVNLMDQFYQEIESKLDEYAIKRTKD